MAIVVNRNKHNLFKKRHYIAIVRATVSYCTVLFGYQRQPFLFESENRKGEIMCIYRGKKNRCAIFYDYMQFKRNFLHHSLEAQEIYTAFFTAHEMRHYYQMRQLDSKNPRESSDIIAAWRENDENPKNPIDGDCTCLEFYKQPMELDAQLFAYMFVANMYNSRIVFDYIDQDYIAVLEDYYIRRYGKTNDELFPHETP